MAAEQGASLGGSALGAQARRTSASRRTLARALTADSGMAAPPADGPQDSAAAVATAAALEPWPACYVVHVGTEEAVAAAEKDRVWYDAMRRDAGGARVFSGMTRVEATAHRIRAIVSNRAHPIGRIVFDLGARLKTDMGRSAGDLSGAMPALATAAPASPSLAASTAVRLRAGLAAQLPLCISAVHASLAASFAGVSFDRSEVAAAVQETLHDVLLAVYAGSMCDDEAAIVAGVAALARSAAGLTASEFGLRDDLAALVRPSAVRAFADALRALRGTRGAEPKARLLLSAIRALTVSLETANAEANSARANAVRGELGRPIRVAVLGEGGVGKTSLVGAIVASPTLDAPDTPLEALPAYDPTAGVVERVCELELGGKMAVAVLCEVAGVPLRELAAAHGALLAGVDGAMMVYSAESEASFNALGMVRQQLAAARREHPPHEGAAPLALLVVANKTDYTSDDAVLVPVDVGVRKAALYGADFAPTNCTRPASVRAAWAQMLSAIVEARRKALEERARALSKPLAVGGDDLMALICFLVAQTYAATPTLGLTADAAYLSDSLSEALLQGECGYLVALLESSARYLAAQAPAALGSPPVPSGPALTEAAVRIVLEGAAAALAEAEQSRVPSDEGSSSRSRTPQADMLSLTTSLEANSAPPSQGPRLVESQSSHEAQLSQGPPL